MPKKPNPIVAEDYEPYEDYIMLEPEQEPEKSEGGIVIPEQARNYLNEAKILKTGPNVSEKLRPGMYVVFEKASEYRLQLGTQIIFVVKEPAIILHREDKIGALFPA